MIEVKRNDLFQLTALLAMHLSMNGPAWKNEADAVTPAQLKRLGGPPKVLNGMTYVEVRDLHTRLAPLIQGLARDETTITVTD